MTNSIVFMYSGQGSQYYHMGRDLFAKHAGFRKWMTELDGIVYDITGESVISHIYDDGRKKSDFFNKLSYSHPAIFMVEYSLTQVLIESGIVPDYLIGLSLGEFVCSAVAGIVSVEDALECVIKQCDTFDNFCPKGGMIAILDDVGLFNNDVLAQNSELAAVNFKSHFVISGYKDKLDYIEQYLRKNKIIYMVLPVSTGFHSSCVDSAKEKFISLMSQKKYKLPEIPTYSCSLLDMISEVDDEYFWGVVRNPIMFHQVMLDRERSGGHIYIDLSPSGTLDTFAKRIIDNTRSKSFSLLNPFASGVALFERTMGNLRNL